MMRQIYVVTTPAQLKQNNSFAHNRSERGKQGDFPQLIQSNTWGNENAPILVVAMPAPPRRRMVGGALAGITVSSVSSSCPIGMSGERDSAAMRRGRSFRTAWRQQRGRKSKH
jgi:hypothetical protein